ncbi:MAG: hypothetical protein ACRD18_16370 [Terriglobia bacterium]
MTRRFKLDSKVKSESSDLFQPIIAVQRLPQSISKIIALLNQALAEALALEHVERGETSVRLDGKTANR